MDTSEVVNRLEICTAHYLVEDQQLVAYMQKSGSYHRRHIFFVECWVNCKAK